jgi:hypothetical protein
MTHLLSMGGVVFSGEEARLALGVSQGALLDAAERQQRKQHLVSPRRGLYVIVPPQYLAWGAPPPSWYIDDLMRHEGRPYYVGLLKAAELHGATHQAVMEFQVVTNKRLPKIRAGRSPITFYYRKDMAAVSEAIEDRKTDTGRMNVSSVELTLLDLMRYPHAGGRSRQYRHDHFRSWQPHRCPENLPHSRQHSNDPSDSVSATCWIASVSPTAHEHCTRHCLKVRASVD